MNLLAELLSEVYLFNSVITGEEGEYNDDEIKIKNKYIILQSIKMNTN